MEHDKTGDEVGAMEGGDREMRGVIMAGLLILDDSWLYKTSDEVDRAVQRRAATLAHHETSDTQHSNTS